MKIDIKNRADIEHLVRTFYAKLLSDEIMAPHFHGIDFEHHFPRMIGFWAFILLDEQSEMSNVFQKHIRLDVHDEHFEHWIEHFCQTVDGLFAGEKADKAKQNAQVIGYTFKTKMKYLKNLNHPS
jgi:hemoglobin